jgi:hypothetical protein
LQRLTPCSLNFGAAAGYRTRASFISDHRTERTSRAFGLPSDLREPSVDDEPLRIADIRLPKKMTLL